MKPWAAPGEVEDFIRAWGGASELPPEIRLWRAALIRALQDAESQVQTGTASVDRAEARAWLVKRSTTRDLCLELWSIDLDWFESLGLSALRQRWAEADRRLHARAAGRGVAHTALTASINGLPAPACSGMSL